MGEGVEYLLTLNPDTTIGEKDGYTPLHGAGFQGRAEIAKMLLDYGLNPLDSHKDGFLPIHRACWGKNDRHTDTVQVFLDAGISWNVKSGDGNTCEKMTKNRKTKKLLKSYKKRQKAERKRKK